MKLCLLGAAGVAFALAVPSANAVPIAERAPHATVHVASRLGSRLPGGSRDPADSLYTAARVALGNGNYQLAAKLFHDVGTRYPQSVLLPDAMYYEAFSQYRIGGAAAMQAARTVLASLQKQYPDFGRRSDAATLATRVCGELARRGDASCAATISQQAYASTRSAAASHGGSAYSTSAAASSPSCANEDDDERIAALNALLQMDADRAEPILEKVLERRDACSASLRRKAVFLVAQKDTPQAADVLLRAAQTDPDPEVRVQAVFWISQVPGERSVNILSQILRKSSDPELRGKALFALGQAGGEHGTALLRDYAADATQPSELRETAVFWLSQQKGGTQNTAFLRDLYFKLTDTELKEKILFSLSQGHAPDRVAWLLSVAQRPSESIEMRKQALFLAGQAGASLDQLVHMYDALPPGELREQMIFVLSQSRDPAALDKLISIARTDKDPESRKKALFWVGQSHDPRALKALTEVIEK